MNAEKGGKAPDLIPVSAGAVPSEAYAVVHRVPTVEEYNRARGAAGTGFRRALRTRRA